MNKVNTIALTLLLGATLVSCKSQNPQSSSQLPQPPSSPSSGSPSPSIPSPSSPSSPSRPSLPSSSSSPSSPTAQPPSGPSLPGGAPPIPSTSSRSGPESSQQSRDSKQKGEQGSPQTAEEIYGARPGAESRQSEDIPDLDAQPSASEAATHEQLLEVLADIDGALEEAANDPNTTPAEQARIEQYQDVLGDIRVSVENGQLDPAGEQALLDILADLEGSIEASERAQANNGNEDIPVTITIEQVAILQDLINVLGIPGATPGIGFPSLPGFPTGGSASRTGGETLGDLDAALEASIGVFDGMILSERVNAQGKPGEFEGSEEYTGGAEGLFEEGDPAEAGAAGGGPQQQAESPEFPGNEENAPQGAQGGGGGIGQAGQNAAIPNDIPDGRDDDIVARQIREAAQNETDPELREKLWDEYRRYKNGK
ncbi:hypothetical protein QSV34_05140 [Porticoccus sp. W117]|uniref:hypothetical protein n=1 Tax=Porticoccus sp. W117 TaxID=3054777 RepID=UPI002592C34F|nr:hypothetical protein [Porticoccus sp. W117]MDM3870733.1 hypothetical protein [Porticoccus sp. W117]